MTKRVNIPEFGIVNFPDDMPEAEISAAIERDIMPKVEEQRAVGRRTAFTESTGTPLPAPVRRFLPASRFLDLIARPDVGRGVMDVPQAAKQLYQHVTGAPGTKEDDQALSQELMEYEQGRGAPGSFDWGRLGGNVGATSFLGMLRAPGLLKYPLTSLQGGVAAGLQPVDASKGDFTGQKLVQTGVGAVTAPVAQFGLEKAGGFIANRGRQLGDFLSTTLRRFTGRTANPNAVVDQAGNLTAAGSEAAKKLGIDWSQVGDDAKAALRQLADDATRAGRALSPEQALRSTLIKEVTGEEATLGQVTRDFAQQQTEHELKKINAVGAPIRARFAKQNRGLIAKIDELTAKTGGKAIDEYEVGRRVSTSVKAADQEAREAVGMLYKEIDQRYGGSFKIKPEGLLAKLDEISDNAEADAIVTSVKRKLSRFGLLNAAGNNIKRGASLNASQAEELRKFVGGQITGDTPNKKRMLSLLVDSLDDDVKASAGEDVYAIARKVAKTRFEDLRIPAVRAIVDDDVPAEQIFDRYVRRGAIDDLEALKDYMSRKTPMQTKAGVTVERDPHLLGQAWDELRGETLKHVFADATKQQARNELDDVVFSGPMFKKSLDKLGRRKLELMFTPEELAKLDKITKVAEWRTPMADVLNTSNTNSAWWNMVDRLLSYLPGRAGMVARGAGRAAKVGADELAREAAARAAMAPGEELARQAEEEAAARAAMLARKTVIGTRAPTFFSLGGERKRQ